MKLKFERFEGLTSFTVREQITGPEIKILQIGLENLVKELESTLVVNLLLATFSEGTGALLQSIKKALPAQTKHKIHWISPVKNLGDFPTLNAFTSRLTGFKHRQIGERLMLEDQIHELTLALAEAQAKVADTTGDSEKARSLILQNITFKVQEKILKETIHYHRERMKLQNHVPSLDEEVKTKSDNACIELKKAYEMSFEP